MKRNFELNKDKIASEPLHNLLAFHGHTSAHECVRRLVMDSRRTGKPLQELAFSDKTLRPYLEKFSKTQLDVVFKPLKYLGIAPEKTEQVTALWEKRLREAKLWFNTKAK
jgi:hypothetical protein